jgi:hypothetical protein
MIEMNDRFEPTGNSAVIDHETGLEWQADATGLMSWQEAMNYSVELDYGWRLPTIQELFSLINHNRSNPATEFPGHPATGFWSSSIFTIDTNFVWYVYFYYGYVNISAKIDINHVRCVRYGLQDGGA